MSEAAAAGDGGAMCKDDERAQQAAQGLAVGTRVRVQGLSKSPQYKDLVGAITGEGEGGRWQVVLEKDGRAVSLKGENLVPVKKEAESRGMKMLQCHACQAVGPCTGGVPSACSQCGSDFVEIVCGSGDGDEVHAGVTCDECNMSPIVGTRWKCCMCADFDFCNACHTAFAVQGNTSIHIAGPALFHVLQF